MENELDRLKRLANDSHDTIKKLTVKKKELKKLIHNEMDNYFRIEEKIKTIERESNNSEMIICQHVYSKSMDQPYPRLCVKCKEPEND